MGPVRINPEDCNVDEHWKWRYQYAEAIAAQCRMGHFDVKAIYLIGSVKNANAGPMSDIDLLIHFCGTEGQREELIRWLDGWDAVLTEINCLKTGCLTDRMLDLHFVTDDDIRNNTSFASHIGAVTDGARLLKPGEEDQS